jgi:ribosomal protein S18 acetylase RimI-like enzyme
MVITIKRASVSDAEEILALQKLAFQNETNVYPLSTIPPLTQTLEEIKAKFKVKTFFKAISDGKIVGSIRAYREGNICYPEKLIVHPSFWNLGIGTKLMQEMEKYYIGRVAKFRISTDPKNERNMRLYQKFGYRIFKTRKISDSESFVYLEKLSPIC